MFRIMMKDKTRKRDAHPLGWIGMCVRNRRSGRVLQFATVRSRHDAREFSTRWEAEAVAVDMHRRIGARLVVVERVDRRH